MQKMGRKISEALGAADNLTKFKKFSKLKASYVEYDGFRDSNLHEGYFCYNCVYWLNHGGGRCMRLEHEELTCWERSRTSSHHTDAVHDTKRIMKNCLTHGNRLRDVS